MDGVGVEVWLGNAQSWECDTMGHLNVGNYVAKCMEGLAGLARELGMPDAFTASATSTLAVREQHIRFLREARPSAILTMTGGVLEMGESEARVLLLLHHADGALSASFNTVIAHVTAADLRPFPWPERVRARAEALKIGLPGQAAPRGVSLEPVAVHASLKRAEILGLPRIGLGVVKPSETDPFGRLRTDVVMARISASASHLVRKLILPTSTPETRQIGGAVLEYRLIHLDYPGVGRGFEMRSGLASVEPRSRRLVHWILDRDTGRPWAVAEAVKVAFDLKARRITELDPEAQAQLQAAVKPGLTL